MYDIGCLQIKHLRVKIFHKQYTITFLVSRTKNQNGQNSFEHMHASQFLGIWTNGYILSKVTLAVPAFHVYGHRVACQVVYQSYLSSKKINCLRMHYMEKQARMPS